MESIATIILAAGESSRMGTPKQLLRWGGTTLIRRAAQAAIEASLGPVVVVLGAFAADVTNELPRQAQVLFNRDWSLGMHTSIYCGIKAIESSSDLNATIIMNADQPFVTSEILRAIAKVYGENPGTCIASQYAETFGTPALFDRELFPKLKELKDGGAKTLIKKLSASIVPFPFPMGEIDIDTQQDYNDLLVVNVV